MNLPAQKADKSRAAAPIRNMADVDLRTRFQEFAFNMRKRSHPSRGVPQHARLRLRQLDEIGDRVGRYRWMHGQDFGGFRKTCNGRKCFRTVSSALVDQRRYQKR